MLNSGLLLRKPQESSFGAARRFLIANPALNECQVKSALNIFERPNEYHCPGYIFMLIKRFEEEYCKHYKIHYFEPKLMPQNTVIRQCWDCARIGYHSHLFQLPWLTHCPIHNSPLSTHCPSCNKCWKYPPTALCSHKCDICGISISLESLIENDELKNNYGVLKKLNGLIDKYTTNPRICIRNRFSSPYTLHYHSALSINHDLFPSIILKLHPEYKNLFGELNLKVIPVTSITFPYKKIEYRRIKHNENCNLIDIVRKKIKTTLYDNNESICYTDPKNGISLNGIDKETDVDLCALTIWNQTVHSQRHEGNRLNAMASYFYQTPVTNIQPRIPVNMHFTDKDSSSVSIGCVIERSLLPAEIVNLVYLVDLYQCYESIKLYIQVYKQCVLAGQNWTDFYRLLPFSANPENNYSDKIVAHTADGDFFKIILPSDMIDAHFSDQAQRKGLTLD